MTKTTHSSEDNNMPQALDKTRQRELNAWLKAQQKHAKRALSIASLIGLLMGVTLILQAGLLATLLHQIIILHTHPNLLIAQITSLFVVFILRAMLFLIRDNVLIKAGQQVRFEIRQALIRYFTDAGPVGLQHKNAGEWSSLLVEQIDNLQDYYARYLPQMRLASTTPVLILIAVFYFNWAAGLILLLTAPLIPLFMMLVGWGAAEANRRNFAALARLSGYFLDRLKGLDTLRIFYRKQAELNAIEQASDDFRKRTMEVLRLAFLSSGVLEFFTSVSIALLAVYFGFSFLGDLNFGYYNTPLTLFVGFFCLMLAPEFYQPLRDLGAFYHAKAQAIAAADNLAPYLDLSSVESKNSQTMTNPQLAEPSKVPLNDSLPFGWQSICAENVTVLSHDGIALLGPINFTIQAGDKIALIGESGSGKSSLINALLGFLPYTGSLTIDGIELRHLSLNAWHKQLHWLGQLPHLPANTLIDNVVLGSKFRNLITLDCTYENLPKAIKQALIYARVDEFLPNLAQGIHSVIGEEANSISVGQAQRISLARLFIDLPIASSNASSENSLASGALSQNSKAEADKTSKTLCNRNFWLLDEPTASLDEDNAKMIMDAIVDTFQPNKNRQTAHAPHSDTVNKIISTNAKDENEAIQSTQKTNIINYSTTILMITHKLSDAKKMERLWQLSDGKLIELNYE